jgi:predicted nucleic acid-binding protein
MKTFITILKWFFGIIFLIGGLAGLFTSFLTGILFLLLGLFILPPTYELFAKKTKLNLPTWAKWTTVIVGCIITSFTIDNSIAEKDVEMDLVVEKASEFINSGQIDSAKVYIEKAKSQYSTNNNKAVDLENELEKYKSDDFAKETLVSMTDEEFEKLNNGELSKPYLSQKSLNTEFIALMKTQAPERAKIIKEVAERKEQEKIERELAEELKKQEEFNKNRKENIDKQFSGWDGSHPALSRMIEKNCRNPDSYEHIETRFRDDGTSIFVITKYRAENGFGGMTIGNVTARVDFSGNVIEIISQD